MKDVINQARQQYEEAALAARSNRSTSLAKEVVDLTLDDLADDGLQDAILSSDQLMSLLDLAVPSLEEEQRQGTPAHSKFTALFLNL